MHLHAYISKVSLLFYCIFTNAPCIGSLLIILLHQQQLQLDMYMLFAFIKSTVTRTLLMSIRDILKAISAIAEREYKNNSISDSV